MWPSLLYLLAAVVGYLLGSIPTGYLVGKRYGIDIREHGSKSTGATNVVRVLGKRPGYLVFACDLLKGLAAVWLASLVVSRVEWQIVQDAFRKITPDISGVLLEQLRAAVARSATLAEIIAAVACILGHNFPVWLRFKGGKGVATTVGVLVGLMPGACLVTAVVWFTAFYIWRYVSLASLLGAAILPAAVWYLSLRPDATAGSSWPMFIFSMVASALIFWRHRSNISRLLHGTESRFAPKPRPPTPPPAAS